MGTDHLSFLPHGVPAFAVVQDEAEYRKTHHTESDTFDKVYPDEINQGAKVLAAWAYNVAMLPEILPRDPKPAAARNVRQPRVPPAPRPEAQVGPAGPAGSQGPGRRSSLNNGIKRRPEDSVLNSVFSTFRSMRELTDAHAFLQDGPGGVLSFVGLGAIRDRG